MGHREIEWHVRGMNYLLFNVALILGVPLALCVITTRIKREGLSNTMRRIAVFWYAAADTYDCAKREFHERKLGYLRNAGLSGSAVEVKS